MSDEESFVNKKYKLVPPDGGWGYAILVSVIIISSTIVSFFSSMGMIFKDFMIEIKMGSTGFVLMNAFSILSFSLAGYATGPMSKMMTLRQISFLGSTINVIGWVGTWCAKSQVVFYIVQGTAGVGCGFLYNVSTTLINDYFLKKRLLAMTLSQIFPAVGSMIVPLFVKWALDEYGYRGTFLLIAGVNMQNFIATYLIQPVAWHMKRVPLTDEDLEEQNSLIIKPSKDVIKKEDKDGVNVIKMTINNGDQTVDESNAPSDNIQDNIPSNDSTEQISIWAKIARILDLNLLNDFRFVSASVGVSICSFADTTFLIMLPLALYSMHWDKKMVAWALTLYSFGDLATRLAIIVFSKPLAKIGNKTIYMLGLALTIVTKIGMLGSNNTTAILIYLTIMGVSRCTIGVLFPIVLSDCVDPHLFSQAIGISLLILGISNLLFGPLIGAVRDLTNSYAASFYIITSVFTIILLFWSIEICYTRNQMKERKQKTNTKKSNKPK